MYLNLREPCLLKYDDSVIPFLPRNITVTANGDISIEGRQLCSAYFANHSKIQAMKIERVIFNDPATIVIWSDKTKTVVKCQPGDTYDPEKGLALCISKKFFGNKGNFNNMFKQWIPKSVETIDDENDDVIRVGSKVEVVKSGLHYSTYDKWVKKNVKSETARNKWGGNNPTMDVHDGNVGYVVCIADHEHQRDTLAYVDFGKHCAIISIEGLKKIK